MAAGMGSRFGGLKQLAAVGGCGEVLVEYSVFDAMRHGCRRVVFVVRPEMEEDFRALVCSRLPGSLEVELVFQRKEELPAGVRGESARQKPWGTAHAVWSARDVLRGEVFAVVNADDFYGGEGFEALANFWGRQKEGNGEDVPSFALVGYLLVATLSEFGPVSRGVCLCGEDGRLTRIVEMGAIGRDPGTGVLANREGGREIALSGEEVVSMNLWGFDGSVFGVLEENFEVFAGGCRDWERAEWQLPTAMGWAVATGRAKVEVIRGGVRWFGLTYPQDLPRAREEILALTRDGIYPSPLWGAR